jgi:hypothetical protein
MKPTTLKAYRLTHLYTGVFLAPAILFFAISGFLQMFSFHEATHAAGYVPPPFIVRLSRLHKKATFTLPPPAPPKPAAPKLPGKPSAPPETFQHFPMKVFFGFVAVGLVVSTISGLVMAWKYSRRKWVPSSIFFAGIALPLLLLLF